MMKRTEREWRRLVCEFESCGRSRRDFCEVHGLSMATLDYWRRRTSTDGGGRLVQVEIEADAPTAAVLADSLVITWPNGVRVEMGAGAASAAVVGALHGAFGGGEPCSR